jgi:hypothetical protein
MSKGVIVLTCIFISTASLVMIISAHRSSHTASAQAPEAPVSPVVPPGSRVHVRLLQPVSEDSKPGDILQAVVIEPVLVSSRIAIPVNTRALTRVDGIQAVKDGMARVTIELSELLGRNRKVPVGSAPITKQLKPLSDVDVLARGVFGVIDGALGAAGSASTGRNPGSAGTAGPLSAGAAQQDTPEELVFTTAKPLDLTAVSW